MNIQKLKERLADLKRKARDKAASEAEAHAAMEMAMRLAAKYGVSLDDIRDDNSDVEFRKAEFESNGGSRVLHEVDSLLGVAIGQFCDVKPWRNGGTMFMYGIEADVELANFLRDRLKRTMEYEFAIYKRFVHEGPLKGVRASWMRGFADRVRERMKAIKRDTAHYNRDSKALVVRKAELIAQRMAAEGIHLGSARRGRQINIDGGAYAAGQVSGRSADIGRGVGAKPAGLLS